MKKAILIASLLAASAVFTACTPAPTPEIPDAPDTASPENAEQEPETAPDAEPSPDDIIVLDGDGSVYYDANHRTKYANCLFEDDDPQMWAIAFLGYGDEAKEKAPMYMRAYFTQYVTELEELEQIEYDGDEWYLIVPRYPDSTELCMIDENGTWVDGTVRYPKDDSKPFLLRCNLSDIYPNVVISSDLYGGYNHTPTVSLESGKLNQAAAVLDITIYETATK